ncbi:MAG: DUF1156 domain-containing protein [Chloroflexales bacterium]
MPTRKLIEVALPLDDINIASAREKSIRHGHPSTLHLWWARRPLAACRAVLFASLIDDPDQEGVPTELLAEIDRLPAPELLDWQELSLAGQRRQRLFRFIKLLVQWESSSDERVLATAHRLIQAATGGNPPPIYDPFAGGGSIPLEAQRLGLEAHASDLNPVAVLINKALIEIPPKFAGMPPVNPIDNPGARASRAHKGWHSRGYLPHFDQPGLMQSITFRLADAMPADRRAEWADMLNEIDDVRRHQRIEGYLDAAHGSCALRDERVAELVQQALLHFDSERYRLLAWVIMPNHVHVLIETFAGYPLDQILHSWKSYTAKEANKLLGRTGEFWQPEYFDRYIRDERHLADVVSYIHENPVKAGLASRAEDWVWSSARDHAAHATGTVALPVAWKGAAGLAADVRYYGKWMRDEAERRIGHLYPKVRLPKEHGSGEATVIAWIWARTVQCPNPACGAAMPLVRSFALSMKKGKETWVEPLIERGDGPPRVRFEVRSGSGKPSEGTVGRKGATCICCSSPVSLDHVRAEGRAGRIGTQMMVIVAEGNRSRIYLPPSEEHEQIAASARPIWAPEAELVYNPRYLTPPNYGFDTFAKLFTQRQLVALTTFSDLVGEARERVRKDAETADVDAYADAVTTYLAFGVDRSADFWGTGATWSAQPKNELVAHAFTKQTISMTWDFAEASPFSQSGGNFEGNLAFVAKVAAAAKSNCQAGHALQKDAAAIAQNEQKYVFSTDPPYYDNVPYADLSDFFYVWIRASLKRIYPELFGTMLVPKAQELVAEPFRHGGREAAQRFFEEGLLKVFERIRAAQSPDYPLTVYYAFKQAESDDENEETSSTNGVSSSTGWETMLEGLIRSGFAINGTWPMRTEREARTRGIGSNALATSIILVCRPRPEDVRSTSRLEFVRALRRELPAALRALQSANIAPVDLAQAAIGPGMAIYSRYRAVLEADGTPMRVRAALQLINQALDEVLAEQEGAYDADTRWAIAWFEQFAFEEGAYGVAETLSKAKNTSVQGMVDAGVALARAGKVRLLRRNELPEGWLPTTDGRLTAWEMTQHLVWALDQGGEQAAAVLLQAAPGLADAARDLAYRLYSTCERKKWAQEALAYNSLVIAWPEIARLAVEHGVGGGPVQGRMEI